MKKLLAFITIASLTLGTASFAFAEEVEGTEAPDVEITEEVEEEAEEVEETEEEVAEVEEVEAVVAEEVTPVPLNYKTKEYTVESIGITVGQYPEIKDNAALTKKIVLLLAETYTYYIEPSETAYIGVHTDFFSFEIEELATAAKITLNFSYAKNAQQGEREEVLGVFYVDTITSQEITEEAFEALRPVVAEEVPAEEVEEEVTEVEEEVVEVAAEPVLVPVRSYAEALGYEVIWSPEGTEITDGTNSTVLVLDVNSYVAFDGTVVELDAAPVLVDGTMYVTVEFFSEILGAEVIVNLDGSVAIIGAVVETEEEVAEEVETTEEEAETEEVEAPADEETTGEVEAPADEEAADEADAE